MLSNFEEYNLSYLTNCFGFTNEKYLRYMKLKLREKGAEMQMLFDTSLKFINIDSYLYLILLIFHPFTVPECFRIIQRVGFRFSRQLSLSPCLRLIIIKSCSTSLLARLGEIKRPYLRDIAFSLNFYWFRSDNS